MSYENKTEEYLSRCVVDAISRKVYLYSNLGDTKTVSCDTVDEFMNVLQYVRSTLDEDSIGYSDLP